MSYQQSPPVYDDNDSVELQDSNFRQLESDFAFQFEKPKTIPILGNLTELTEDWRQTLRTLFAEFWGTMLFVYIGTGAVMSSKPLGTGVMDAPTVILVSMAFGFGIATMVYATANISGGHLNPAVTIGIVAVRKMSILRGSTYIIAQCLGSICGSALLRLSIPKDICEYSGYGATTIARNVPLGDNTDFIVNVTAGGGLLMEFMLTYLLVFTVFSTASLPGESKDMGKFAPLSIGFAVLVCHIVGIPYTGPSLNPARSFGPAVVGGVWTDHWVYWVGPIFGGLLGSVTYTFGIASAAEKEKASALRLGVHGAQAGR